MLTVMSIGMSLPSRAKCLNYDMSIGVFLPSQAKCVNCDVYWCVSAKPCQVC